VISLFLDPHNGTVEMNEGIVTLIMIIYLDELNENVEDSD
ncbi:17540_t:CDS:2, partial [Funneliformis geosporum]